MQRLTKQEVQDILGVSLYTLNSIIAAGQIETVTFGRRVFIPDWAVDEYQERLETGEIHQKSLIDKMNEVLSEMGLNAMTGREEVLIEALERCLTPANLKGGQEKNRIAKALEEHDGNIRQAAMSLDIPYSTMQYKITKYGLR